MASNLKWGDLALNPHKSVSVWNDKKEQVHSLVNDVVLLSPSNDGKSKSGNPQYKSDANIILQFATFTFCNGFLIGQIKPSDLDTITNFKPESTEVIDKWVESGCVIAIECKGNKHLEFCCETLPGIYFTSNLEIDPNNKNWVKPSDDDAKIIKEIIENGLEEVDDESQELFDSYLLPSQLLIESLIRSTKKYFKIELKTLEELQKLGNELKIDNTASTGGSKGSSKGGNTYLSYESSLEKFKNFCLMLGLPATSTVFDIVRLYRNGIPTPELKIAAAFCKVLLPRINDEYGLSEGCDNFTADNDGTGGDDTDNANSADIELSKEGFDNTPDYILATERLIKDKLPTKKLPASWEISEDVSETWCKTISWIVSNNDCESIAFSKSIGGIMGSSKKSSLVLYSEEELLKIAIALGMQ